MAIKNFKKIEERKGYLVEDDDRQIFEKEIGKAYFGLGTADMIEFILYDSNDNPLPQGDSGRLVRYININDEESKKYFLISENQFTKKSNDAPELIFDIEQLVRDAGYNVGKFKTQLTLLNRRVGKEEINNDKLWIHEISPSRTEIRLLPIKNTDNPSEDLLKRYDTFVQGKEFRDDTIYYIQSYIESLDIQRVFEKFLRIKGSVATGQQYISLLKKEFKIESVEDFFTQVKNKFVEAMMNFSKGNVYNITDINYGKPKPSIDLVELSIDEIKRTTSEILSEVIDYYLPKRNIQDKNVLTEEQQVTFDKIKNILKTVGGNGTFESSVPNEVNAQVRGCTDPDALNYNPTAEIDNGTCEYRQDPPPPTLKKGCTDPEALNYDPRATSDDGSCEYDNTGGTETTETETFCNDVNAINNGQKGKCIYPKPTETKTWYVWSNTASIQYINGDVIQRKNYNEYDEFTITYDVDGLTVVQGDIREYPKSRPTPIETRQYYIINLSHRSGGNSPTPDPFNPPTDFPPPGYETGRPMVVNYEDSLGNPKNTGTIQPGSDVSICAKRGSVVPMEGVKVIEQGVCGFYPSPTIDFPGCTNPRARNYDPLATVDNGSCRYLNSGGGGGSFGGETEPGNRTSNPLNDLENEQRERGRTDRREL
jgi:hypothetical protein